MTDWTNIKVVSPYDDSPDAVVAQSDELNHVIATQNVPVSQPRFNPNMPYADIALKLDDRDELLLKAIKRAIDNGWQGWRLRVNDAITIGLEAEGLVKEMKKQKASAKDLLYDQEFNQFLWGEEWKDRLRDMVIDPDVIMYLKANI